MADRHFNFRQYQVRAALDGRLSQARVVLKQQPRIRPEMVEPPSGDGPTYWAIFDGDLEAGRVRVPYAIGDRLWVRESFSYETLDVDRNGFMPPWYWADGNPTSGDFTRPKPSIHMPRWASRLTLTVTDVRVQRLQEISAADARGEGVVHNNVVNRLDGAPLWSVPGTSAGGRHAIAAFSALLDQINGPGAWAANPWVVALTFTVERGNIDTLGVRHA